MDASSRIGASASTLAVAIALGFAPFLVGAAPDSARPAPDAAAVRVQEPPLQIAIIASNDNADDMRGVGRGDQHAVTSRRRAAPPGGSLAHRARPGPASLPAIDLRLPSVAARAPLAAPGPPLRLALTPPELQALIARYQKDSGDVGRDPIDDVLVNAHAEPLPMRDLSQDVWGGIGAPLWAVLHPTQAWRIFMPIPPK